MPWFGPTNRGYSSGLVNGASVTLTGVNFGTKSRALAPLVRDKGQDAVGSINAGYVAGYPRLNGTAVYNRQNQTASTFNPNGNGSPVGAPHSFVSKIVAGCYQGTDSNTGWAGGLGVGYTIPTLPYAWYHCSYYRMDPAWFDTGRSINFKSINFNNTAGGPIQGTMDSYTAVAWGPTGQTGANGLQSVQDNQTALQIPTDAASHSNFWGTNPLTPISAWVFMECEIVISTVSDIPANGGGRISVWYNGTKYINYQGRTCNTSDTTQYVWGPRTYTNDWGNALNFDYFADLCYDATATIAATGGVARVVFRRLTDGMTAPPADLTSWTNTQITGTFWQGTFLRGDVIVADVYPESGSVQTAVATFTVG